MPNHSAFLTRKQGSRLTLMIKGFMIWNFENVLGVFIKFLQI